jgi:hypothetical protein
MSSSIQTPPYHRTSATWSSRCTMPTTSMPIQPLTNIARCQALNLFRRKTGLSVFFDVNLEKVVPHGEH